jgi:myosin heavy subunit
VFAENVGPRLETEFARLETTVVAKTARLDRAARRAREELARARGTLASKRGDETETTKRIASLTEQADEASAQRDAALEAVRETARNFDDERARLTTELKETRRRLDATERDASDFKNERDAARREVVSVARAADKQAIVFSERAARDGAQRERERHEASTRRFRLEAETAQKEAERCASLLRRAELVAARGKKEAETALVAERAAFDATVAKRDAAIRELKVARDALLAERRELKASAAAADASRRVERAARRETLDALERVKHAPGSPASPRAKSGTTTPKATKTPPKTLSPAKSARTKTRAPLGALLSRAGGVPGASASFSKTPRGERSRTVREPFSEVCSDASSVSREGDDAKDDDEDVSFGARLPPVSLEDLEKSPSWQLQRRLESLEARAAALLLDEEEEAARR